MNIAFLDDDLNRIKNFRRYVPSAHIEETAEGIINHIKKQDVIDVLFLDHDLGGEQFVDSSLDNTGMGVVRWIQKNRPKINTIVVHSHNPDAAKEMNHKLNEYGYNSQLIPFINLIGILKNNVENGIDPFGV